MPLPHSQQYCKPQLLFVLLSFEVKFHRLHLSLKIASPLSGVLKSVSLSHRFSPLHFAPLRDEFWNCNNPNFVLAVIANWVFLIHFHSHYHNFIFAAASDFDEVASNSELAPLSWQRWSDVHDGFVDVAFYFACSSEAEDPWAGNFPKVNIKNEFQSPLEWIIYQSLKQAVVMKINIVSDWGYLMHAYTSCIIKHIYEL